tara:strand:- start:490 stop:1206 length:717 start_codon:yes stop_codon:yes gene_type:complete
MAAGDAAESHESDPSVGRSSASVHARLIRIHSGGADGDIIEIGSKPKTIGRIDADICFSEDAFVSPLHASIFFDDDRLMVRDEQSANGVFKRLSGSVILKYGDVFMAGEELMRIEDRGPDLSNHDAEGTSFFGSAPNSHPYAVRQILEGGLDGLLMRPRANRLTIGRERCDLEFPYDRFISSTHCRLEFDKTGVQLTDLDSRNGTYTKVNSEAELHDGDFIFIGRQLLRVAFNVPTSD